MFRSDEEAAVHRADALQRELDAARDENELLQRQLANAMARLSTVANVDTLQRDVYQLSEQLASMQALLNASENERRRLESLHPVRPRKLRTIEYKNPGSSAPPAWVLPAAVVFALCMFIAMISSR